MIMVPMNLHSSVHSELDEKDDLYLIAAFNKLPREITPENIVKRKYRPFLLAITEELNAKNIKSFDMLDVLMRLLQLRKSGRLRGVIIGRNEKEKRNDGFDADERNDKIIDPNP